MAKKKNSFEYWPYLSIVGIVVIVAVVMLFTNSGKTASTTGVTDDEDEGLVGEAFKAQKNTQVIKNPLTPPDYELVLNSLKLNKDKSYKFYIDTQGLTPAYITLSQFCQSFSTCSSVDLAKKWMAYTYSPLVTYVSTYGYANNPNPGYYGCSISIDGNKYDFERDKHYEIEKGGGHKLALQVYFGDNDNCYLYYLSYI